MKGILNIRYLVIVLVLLINIVCFGKVEDPSISFMPADDLGIEETTLCGKDSTESTQKETGPIIGAIRWDAWHNPNRGFAAKQVEYSLSQKQYHWRAPFFSEVVNDTSILLHGYTQEIVDKEIEFAAEMGLDYWAFLLYDENSPLSDGVNYYLNSEKKDKINFCAMVNPSRTFPSLGTELERLIRYIKEPSYQKVEGNRPLIYFFRPTAEVIEKIGGEEVMKENLRILSTKVKEAGFGEPFKVVMHFDHNTGLEMFDILEADALSTYAIWGDNGEKGNSYSKLTEQCEQFWNKYKESGHNVVPTVMAGWDRRPRIERPVSWEADEQKPGVGMDKYFELPTSKELAEHINQGIQWTIKNNSEEQAKIVLIYSWNEHDEGGWLCPTLNEDGTANKERLQTIKEILKK